MKTCAFCVKEPVAVDLLTQWLVCGDHKLETSVEISRLYYRCGWCWELSKKFDWGSGWMRCPLCKKVAQSAEESNVRWCFPCQNVHDEGEHLS